MGSEQRLPRLLEEEPVTVVLEELVDMFIYNNEFGRAAVAQNDLVDLLEAQGVKPMGQVMRLFRIYLAMQNNREAVTTAIKAIRYGLESDDYRGIVLAYSYIVALGTQFYVEKELTAYCYGLCLSTLIYKEKKPEIDELLTSLLQQVPYFVKCSQYEKLKNKQFHLLCVEDDSYNQSLLVPLVVEKYKQ